MNSYDYNILVVRAMLSYPSKEIIYVGVSAPLTTFFVKQAGQVILKFKGKLLDEMTVYGREGRPLPSEPKTAP